MRILGRSHVRTGRAYESAGEARGALFYRITTLCERRVYAILHTHFPFAIANRNAGIQSTGQQSFADPCSPILELSIAQFREGNCGTIRAPTIELTNRRSAETVGESLERAAALLCGIKVKSRFGDRMHRLYNIYVRRSA